MKNRIILFIFLFFIQLTGICQTQDENDAIVEKFCEHFNQNKSMPDSARMAYSIQEIITPYILSLPEKKREETATHLYYRLQRNCYEFKKILDAQVLNKSNEWRLMDKQPESVITKEECEKFTSYKSHKYLESTGDTTRVDLSEKFWIDHFPDNTYSKLSFKWISDCEFEIEFMKSTNETRKNFSKKGDKYRYQLISFKETYYEVCTPIPDSNKFYLFKIHVK